MFWFCTDSGSGTDSGSQFGTYIGLAFYFFFVVNHNEGVLLAMVK